ncbi:hypothetical protein [Fischerella sp. PCC 9605]|uniref:hypothetical protein n=1 Tax=Fischerella sp. PCC 9605 TaxID=1173024 RepID=UPI00047B13D9|nr:hypothetical protein [Fischerella sp. PCC 9605]
MEDKEYRPRIPKYFNQRIEIELQEMGETANVTDFITKVLTYYFDMKEGNVPFQMSGIVQTPITTPISQTSTNQKLEDIEDDDRSSEFDIGL